MPGLANPTLRGLDSLLVRTYSRNPNPETESCENQKRSCENESKRVGSPLSARNHLDSMQIAVEDCK